MACRQVLGKSAGARFSPPVGTWFRVSVCPWPGAQHLRDDRRDQPHPGSPYAAARNLLA
jgi:hypothetical protein